MFLDVLRVVAAACFAMLIPGYLWAAVLVVGSGWVERVTVGLALSLTLVPLATLGASALLGGGVSWSVAAVGVAVVYMAGAVALLLSGRAGSTDEQCSLASEPRVHFSTMLLVAVALVLLLAAALERMPRERLVVPMFVLLIGAVVTQMVTAHYSRLPQRRTEIWSRVKKGIPLHHAILACILGLALVRGYIGPARHEWPFLRGVDQYAHTVLVNMRISEGPSQDFLIYPAGFHTLSAVLSQLSGLPPLELYSALAPSVLVLPALAAYVFGRRVYGPWHGLVAALLAGLLLPSSYVYFNDAMYPNLIASQFLLMLALTYLPEVPWATNARPILLAALLGASVLLYHMVASVYLVVLLGAMSVFYLPYLLLRHTSSGVRLLVYLSLTALLAVAYTWDTYELPRTVAALVGGSQVSEATSAVSMAVGTQPPRDLKALSDSVSRPIQWLSALGAVLLLLNLAHLPARTRLATVLLLAWAGLLFAGSRTTLSGFPHRYERDLGAPLALIAAWVLASVPRPALRLRPIALVSAMLTVALLGVEIRHSLIAAGRPSSQVVLNAEIQEAGDWLREHRTGGNIMISPHVNQVPSRAMLALSGYSGLQSFAGWQLQLRRDLPPTGPEPLLDILYIMRSPSDPGVRAVLDKYDVRFVVMYKRFNPGTMWTTDLRWDVEAHRSRTDLYDVAFENESVLILRVRRAA